MKLFILILPFLIGCASSKYQKLNDQEMFTLVSQNQKESFTASEMLLRVKINHENKSVYSCQGVFPGTSDREEILKKIKYQKKLEFKSLIVLADSSQETLVFNINEKSNLESIMENCQKLESFYKSKGYKIIPHSVF